MHPLIATHSAAIADLCRRYGVARLEVFGSATGDGFDPHRSDVDFLVRFIDLTAPRIARRHFEPAEGLEQMLSRPVDLLVDQPLTNPYFAASVSQTRESIFEQSSEEAPV